MRRLKPLTDDDIQWELAPLEASPHDTDDLLTEVVIEAIAYRTLAQTAIQSLHEVTQRNARLRERVCQLLNELRALRMRDAA